MDSAGSMTRLFASDAFAMRMSSLIATLNPMTETTNPARLIQSPALMVVGCSARIIDRGRATFTLFLGATTFCAGRDRRASADALAVGHHNLPSAGRTVQPAATPPAVRPHTADNRVSGAVA